MKKGIKTLKEYLEFVKDKEVTGGTISMDAEILLIEVIKSAIEEHEAEIKAKDEEIAKLEQQNGFSDIYIQDLETQIKAKDERIKELEEAMKPKTCDGCVHEVEDMQDLYCAFCSRSCDDNFEPKDNA